MKEIKFRVWDKEKNILTDYKGTIARILKGYLSGVSGEGLGGNEFDYNRYIIMQYTGLLDKNGVEIYENDIMQFNGEKGFNFQVVWNEKYASWYLVPMGDYYNASSLGKCEKGGEVIGNIYQSN